MWASGEGLEFREEILVLLLVAPDWNGLVRWNHILWASHEDVKGLGSHPKGLDDEGGLLLNSGGVQAEASRCGFLSSCCNIICLHISCITDF